jgi:hypothetical protein
MLTLAPPLPPDVCVSSAYAALSRPARLLLTQGGPILSFLFSGLFVLYYTY